MASLSLDKDGTRRLVFSIDTADGEKRKTFRLGRMAQREAERFKAKVEQLVIANRTGNAADAETALWASKLPDAMHAKLAHQGLVVARERPLQGTLGAFLDSYLVGRTDVGEGTAYNLKLASDNLLSYFGAEKPLKSFTELDATNYRIHLRKTLAENTTRRMVSRARQFFNAAVDGHYLERNPFRKLKGLAVRAVKERQAFIDRATIDKLLDAAPDAEWRFIIAASRFLGIRIPSELKDLRWSDIDLTNSTVKILSPKTAHSGEPHRTVPLFSEVRPWLQDLFDVSLSADGKLPEFVVSRCRSGKTNLRTGLNRIIKLAGLKPWAKLFQNMRASRANELVEQFPAHVANSWLGHTEKVAEEHYRFTIQAHIDRAVKPLPQANAEQTQDPSEERAHFRAQYGAEIGSNGSQASLTAQQKTPVFPGLSVECDYLPNYQATRQGLEP